jgi:hypothetical protein
MIIRNMRKMSPILSQLFTATMQGVLAATVLRPDREWYLSDLAAHLRLGPSSLQGEQRGRSPLILGLVRLWSPGVT